MERENDYRELEMIDLTEYKKKLKTRYIEDTTKLTVENSEMQFKQKNVAHF